MNAFFLTFLTISILNLTTASVQPQFSPKPDSLFFISWITHQTQWPLVLTKLHGSPQPIEYDWYRFDQKDYVSQAANYRPNYFISMEPLKSDLTIFSYNPFTHEALTTYQPIKKAYANLQENSLGEKSEYHTLSYLKSHRIRIDRDSQNTGANITCIADFLVDKASLEINSNLVEEMKNLALFRIDLEEPTRADFKEFTHRISMRNQLMLQNEHKTYAKLNTKKMQRKFLKLQRAKRSIENGLTKQIMNVRLSFGPIYVAQPIEERLVSCSLELVNPRTVRLDYHNKVFKFLTKNNMGLDLNVEDIVEKGQYHKIETSTMATSTMATSTMATSTMETSTMATSTMATSTMATSTMATSTMATSTMATSTMATSTMETSTMETSTMETSTMATSTMATSTMATSTMATSTMATSTMVIPTKEMTEMSDDELNEIFDNEKTMEAIEQKIIKEQGAEKFKEVAQAINNIEKQKEKLVKSELSDKKDHDRRFFDSEFLSLDKDLLFLMDKPMDLDFNSGNQARVTFMPLLFCTAALQGFFFYF